MQCEWTVSWKFSLIAPKFEGRELRKIFFIFIWGKPNGFEEKICETRDIRQVVITHSDKNRVYNASHKNQGMSCVQSESSDVNMIQTPNPKSQSLNRTFSKASEKKAKLSSFTKAVFTQFYPLRYVTEKGSNTQLSFKLQLRYGDKQVLDKVQRKPSII